MKYRNPNKTRCAGWLATLLACWSTVAFAAPPVANPATGSFPFLTEDSDVNALTTWDLDLVFTDPDGDTLTYINPPSDLGPDLLVTASVDPVTGFITFSTVADAVGSQTLVFTATDSGPLPNTATYTMDITFSAVDDAFDDAFLIDEDTTLNGDVAANDTYGGAVTYTVKNDVNDGSLALNTNGIFKYTPDPDFVGTDSFDYDALDVNGDTETRRVTITVNAVDDAKDDAFGTAEDIAISDDVSINDNYTGVATYAVNAPASNGVVALAGDGTFTYTPNGDFNGSDAFTYNATDVNGAVETQTVSITVGGVLDALDDAFSTTEDTVLNEDVSTNDTYTGVVTYAVNAAATDGLVALAGDGTFTYTPNADFNGVDGFTYDATDVNGAVETQTVTINVSAADDAQDDTFGTAEDTVLNEDVSTNDGYVGAVTYTVNTDVADGTLTLAGDGTFSYTPNADFNGTDGFTYDATDSNGGSETQVVVINVSAADDAQDDTFGTAEDTVLNEDVSTNDGYAGAASYAVNADVTNGVLVLTGGGSFSYTPDPDFNGVDTFTYDATDVNATVETQAVTINVGAVNDAPTAVDDGYAATEDTALTVSAPGVLANDGDVDGDSPVVDSNTAAANGAVIVNADGSFTYTPDPDFNGVDSFDYTLDDGNGGTDTGTVTVNVNSINDLPVGVDDSYATNEDIALVISAPGVLVNDTDVDGDGVTVIGDTGTTNGTLTVNADGSFTYTPNADFNGVDGFDYTVDDSNGGTATGSVAITVNAVNDPPVVVDESYATDEDTPLSVPAPGVLANDSDVDGDPLILVSNTNASDGVLSVNADGSFTYAPNADFNGIDSFQYTVDDGVGGTAVGTVTVTVNSINDDPVLVDDTYVTDEDVTINISAPGLLLNDSDVDGDSLAIVSNTNTSDGVLSVNADGSFSYNPKKNFNGADSFQYTVEDGFGGSATATVIITVNSVNDIPVAADDTAAMTEDGGTIVIPVLVNDYLAEEPTTITTAGVGGFSESAATVVLNQGGDAVSEPNGTVTIVGDTVEYRPKDNFYGTDYFTYTITDADGDIGTATVTVTVTQQNDPPTGIQFRSFSMLENGALTVDASDGVLANAYDVDGALLDAFGNPVGEPLSIQPVTLPAVGTLLLNKFDGTFTYTPPVNFTGDVSFTYRLFDDQIFSEGDAYQVSISVFAAPAPAAPPPAGEVAITYNLANVPLEQSTSVPPNVLVVMDDSGSMDWNMIVAGADEQGGFMLDNDAIARNRSDAVSFVYLWDLKTNAYPPSSSFGRILPTDEALAADSDTDNNQYGTWRARTHLHNKMYYNPENYYAPWVGQDALNVEFADADPSAVRLDPVDPGETFDLLAPHSYGARGVPEWDNNGGTETVDVEDMYIPHYYTTTSLPPLAWNDPNKQRVEIKPGAGPLGGMFPGGLNREDCAVGDNNPLDCTYDQELQNFANYFQYYRSREYVTKSGMGRVISQLQDIRVGYETISATTSEPVRDMNDLYTEGNKKALMDNVYSVDSYGGTPLRQALGRAGKILGCETGNDCPRLPDPEGFCQQNFALLFSDGYWNGGAGVPGNDDVDGAGPFDGGRYADGVKATLADVAMFYYENDMHPDFDDQVPVSARDILGAPPGTFAPNDPVMHQHMKTYAIAFGVSGSVNPAAIPSDPMMPFAWPDPFDGPLEKIDDMLHTAVNGRGRFLNAGSPQELQAAFEAAFLEFTQAASSTSSAAFNSTSLRDGTLLYRGFYDLRDNTGELTATKVNSDGTLQPLPEWRASEQLEPAITLPGSRVLVTYDKASRTGIPFRHVDLTPDQQLTINEQQVNFIRGDRANEAPAGPLRERALTGALLGDIVNSSPVFVGEPRSINRDQAPYPVTDLYSEFADAKRNRTPVVYVGANDGIMHGFDATTGREIFGYVPNKILDVSESYRNTLNEFTSPFYQHKFYVDLTPRLNDVYMRSGSGAVSKSWNSVMIGGLGAGGKGFFALNVTDPDTDFASDAAAERTVLWEFTDSDDTYPVNGAGVPLGGAVGAITDPLGKPVKDLGYSLSLPTLAMSNVEDGGSPGEREWVAVFGNGPNSTAGIAKLFVLFMDRGLNGWGDADDFVKIDTGFGVPVAPNQLAGFPNGLGTPAAVDRNLDGTVDWVYAGDRLGNLYRFDLSDPNPDNWNSTRLFTATYFDGAVDRRQPILSQPLVIKHPTEQGFLVIFGTGSYLTKEDASSEEIQSIYGIWDRGESSPPTALADTKSQRLVEQTITNVVDDSLVPQVTRRIISKDSVNYLAESGVPGTYGWYIDLDMPRAATTQSGTLNPDSSGRNPPDAQFPGERAVRRLLFRDGTIITTTVLPSLDEFSCFGTRPGAILLFDAVTGGDPGRAVVDFNTDGVIDQDDMVAVAGEVYAAGVLFDQQDLDGSLVDLSTLGGEGDTDFLFVSGGSDTVAYRIEDINDSRTGRLSWRELDQNQ